MNSAASVVPNFRHLKFASIADPEKMTSTGARFLDELALDIKKIGSHDFLEELRGDSSDVAKRCTEFASCCVDHAVKAEAAEGGFNGISFQALMMSGATADQASSAPCIVEAENLRHLYMIGISYLELAIRMYRGHDAKRCRIASALARQVIFELQPLIHRHVSGKNSIWEEEDRQALVAEVEIKLAQNPRLSVSRACQLVKDSVAGRPTPVVNTIRGWYYKKNKNALGAKKVSRQSRSFNNSASCASERDAQQYKSASCDAYH